MGTLRVWHGMTWHDVTWHYITWHDLIWRILTFIGPCIIIYFYLKPPRCTSFSNIFYFGITLYMFRAVFPSIIRSSRLYIHSISYMSNRYCCLLASNMFDIYLMLYVQSWTPDDGRKDRPEHVECYSKIKYIWEIGASSWFYYRNDMYYTSSLNIVPVSTEAIICSTL